MNTEIIIEYTELLQEETLNNAILLSYPKGYISKKIIGNKEYNYLQYRNGKKIHSRYIKNNELESIMFKLEERKQAEEKLPLIKKRLSEIERAAKLLDRSLYRKLSMLRISSNMDNIEINQKEKSISFSDAMTSIEGIPVSDETKQELDSWKNGKKSFVSVFEHTLRLYGFIKEI